MKTISKHQTLSAVFLLVVGCIIYCLNVFTPLFSDDWHYTFIFGTQTHINSISDIIKSQWIHYFNFNGRSIVHFFVQYFDGILGKGVFNVFNTLLFIAYLCIFTLVITKEKKNYYKVLSVIFILTFLCIRSFKYNFLWLSGSFNYLWVATALLYFHYLIEIESISKKYSLLLIPYGFICGWSQESFVVGLGAAYFIYFLTHRDQLTKHRIYLLTAFFIGAVFLVFAPGSVNRALSTDGLGVSHDSLIVKFLRMRNVTIMYILLAVLVIKFILNKKSFWHWVKKEQLFLIATIVSFCFVTLTGATSEHSRFAIEFFSLILILKCINWNRVDNRIITVANIVVLLIACFICKSCYDSYLLNERELSQIEQLKSNKAEYVVTVQPNIPSWIRHQYALDYSEYTESDIKIYGTTKQNLSRYYGVDSIIFLPNEFIKDLKRNPNKFSKFISFGKLPFYAKEIPNNQEYKDVKIEYKKPSYASWPEALHTVLSKITGEHVECDYNSFKTIHIDGHRYILIDRPFPEQDKSLKRIILEQ